MPGKVQVSTVLLVKTTLREYAENTERHVFAAAGDFPQTVPSQHQCRGKRRLSYYGKYRHHNFMGVSGSLV